MGGGTVITAAVVLAVTLKPLWFETGEKRRLGAVSDLYKCVISNVCYSFKESIAFIRLVFTASCITHDKVKSKEQGATC